MTKPKCIAKTGGRPAVRFVFLLVFLLAAAAVALPVFGQKTAAERSQAEPADGQKEDPAATAPPKVIQIDATAIRDLLKPRGRPLLVNFWATWCVPCQEEFPDLVEIDREFRGQIDFITISLDDLAEIDRDVPKFLSQMRATMPAYLLRTTDENEVIGSISQDWQGGLPFTVLYDEKGAVVHSRQGKINPAFVREILRKLTDADADAPQKLITVTEFVRIRDGRRKEALYYYDNNWKKYRQEAVKRGLIHSYELIVAAADEKTDFDIILITRFADRKNFDQVEENFGRLIKELRPEGPRLKNEIKPADFRENISVKFGETRL